MNITTLHLYSGPSLDLEISLTPTLVYLFLFFLVLLSKGQHPKANTKDL